MQVVGRIHEREGEARKGRAANAAAVDDGEDTEALTVEECVRHEVHRPDLIRRPGLRSLHLVAAGAPTPRRPA